jgi:hypothetical protein
MRASKISGLGSAALRRAALTVLAAVLGSASACGDPAVEPRDASTDRGSVPVITDASVDARDIERDATPTSDGSTPGADAAIETTDCTSRDCRYVLPDGAGARDGSDWANAYASLPDALARGAVYFLGAGSYESYTFDDALDGDAVITIQAPTARDHGTEVGWSAAYAGTAALGSPVRFAEGHYVLDGRSRNESDWFDGASYGIRVEHRGEDQNIVIGSYGVSVTDVTIRYVFVDAIVGDLPDTTIRRYAVDTDGYDGGTTATGLLFSRMFVRGSNNVWFLRTTDGAIVEHSASDGAAGNGANHGEIVNLYYSGENAIIRYNQFRNAYLEGGGTALVAITYADGLQFYGNVAYDFAVGDGAVGFLGGDASHCRIHNNTFVRARGAAGFASDGSDNLVYDNVWVDYGGLSIDGEHDHSTVSGDAVPGGEANGETGATSALFVDAAGGDFHLARATAAGRVLPAPFDLDADGRARGADGMWDRGANEHVSR